MKRLFFLPLLALPLLLVSCDGQTPTEPEQTAETTPLLKPVLQAPGFSTDCTASGGYYYCANASPPAMFVVSYCSIPIERGTFVVQQCKYRSGAIAPEQVCDDLKEGRWVTTTKVPLDESTCSFTTSFEPTAFLAGAGFRVKYRGQGSGYANATFGPWTFYGTEAP